MMMMMTKQRNILLWVVLALVLDAQQQLFTNAQEITTTTSPTTTDDEELLLPITTTNVFIQSGMATESSINIMARCNNEVESSMTLFLSAGVEYTQERTVNSDTDYTHTFVLEGLSPDTSYTYLVDCLPLEDNDSSDETVVVYQSVEGSFQTLPSSDVAKAISFVWVSCLSGQGYGRNPNFEITNANTGEIVKGGYVVFDTMEKLTPDFAVFQGDMIYGDNAIPAIKEYRNGTEVLGTWYNNPTKDFVAVTLDDFRANWKYNHGDEKMQSFLSKIPIYVQWDDHEVTNNWWFGEVLGEPLYANDTLVDDLVEVSLQALVEFNPILDTIMYHSKKFGIHLEIFFPDFRTYRGPNPDNINPSLTDMMGEDQLNWLKEGLLQSTATWKLISAHDPFGIVTGSGPDDYDSFANEDPAILGREFEMQDLLAYISDNNIENVVSISSDVHFAAHVSMSPDRAEGNFTNFKPLEEFVIGPIHGGAFGPNYMDASFGAEYEFEHGPLTLGYERWANLAPEVVELQSFGHASVSEDGELTIKLINIDGNVLYEKTMSPVSTSSSSSTSDTVTSSTTTASPITDGEELPITTTDVFIQSGMATESSINIMARCNTEVESSMTLFLSAGVEFTQETTVTSDTDYTHTFVLEGLSSDTSYTYLVDCLPLDDNSETVYQSVEGSFQTIPPSDVAKAVSFVWVSCLSGQGYGRNPNFEITNANTGEIVKGGYVVFDTMEKLTPDFAVFQGDMVYGDNAIPATKEYMNGTEVLGTWYNNPTKDFVAVTLDDFRANWKYNHGDEKMQSFLSKIPIYVQWDDHEVTNNWWFGEVLGEPLYANDTLVDDLVEVSLQALVEFNPVLDTIMYHSKKFGIHLEIFFPDFRTYRGPNPDNINPSLTDMMGEDQLNWLKEGLLQSTATWKLISAHDPFGIVTGSGPDDYDSFANEDPAILGREFEMQDLLAYISDNNIENVVSISSDVHFAAHVSMSPDRAEGNFTNFKPLEEFVIGPIHGGAFGPNYMDASFGAEYEFEHGPLTLGYERWANLAPEVVELQSFGHASVSEDGELTIKLINIDGNVLYEKTMSPVSTSSSSSSSTSEDDGSVVTTDSTVTGDVLITTTDSTMDISVTTTESSAANDVPVSEESSSSAGASSAADAAADKGTVTTTTSGTKYYSMLAISSCWAITLMLCAGFFN